MRGHILLDFVLTGKERLVRDVKVGGSSDHGMVACRILR